MARRHKNQTIAKKQSQLPLLAPSLKLLACEVQPCPVKAIESLASPRSPRLSVEIIGLIFDAMQDLLHDDTIPSPDVVWRRQYFKQEAVWINLSLVCKDWERMTMAYRGTAFVFPPNKHIRSFVHKLPFLQKKGFLLQRLVLGDAEIESNFVVKLLPSLQSLRSLALPIEMLQNKHIYQLLKQDSTALESITLFGGSSTKYEGQAFWKKLYAIHNIPTLTELSLADLLVQGRFQPFQASIKSPIRKLRLRNVRFDDKEAREHLFWPLVHTVREIDYWLTPHTDHFVLRTLYTIFGSNLEKLCLHGYEPKYRLATFYPEELVLSPSLQDLQILGISERNLVHIANQLVRPDRLPYLQHLPTFTAEAGARFSEDEKSTIRSAYHALLERGLQASQAFVETTVWKYAL